MIEKACLNSWTPVPGSENNEEMTVVNGWQICVFSTSDGWAFFVDDMPATYSLDSRASARERAVETAMKLPPPEEI